MAQLFSLGIMNAPPKLEEIKNRNYARFIGFPCSITRLLIETFVAVIFGIAAFSLPVLFMSPRPPNLEQAVFLPMLSEALEKPHLSSILLILAASFAVGFFGRAPFFLTGPAIMFGFPIWAVIDGLAGGGGHNMIPFEIIMYAIIAPVFIIPSAFGRLLKYLIELWRSHDA